MFKTLFYLFFLVLLVEFTRFENVDFKQIIADAGFIEPVFCKVNDIAGRFSFD